MLVHVVRLRSATLRLNSGGAFPTVAVVISAKWCTPGVVYWTAVYGEECILLLGDIAFLALLGGAKHAVFICR